MHPKFDPTGVRTHDLKIMTVHFMSVRRIYCHDLDVMSSSPNPAERGVRGTSVLSRT